MQEDAGVGALVEDLFRRESAHLVAALARLPGPAQLALAEDVVHDALLSAMNAWRAGVPDDPKAWILQVAKRRAIDVLRRQRRLTPSTEPRFDEDWMLEGTVDMVLSPAADAENQLLMMFTICDDTLSSETHVTLILRLLCGLSASEIARAFLVDKGTIDRRLHRGRTRLRELGALATVSGPEEVLARQPSVEQALYLLFNEGYHGNDADNPLHPAMCADALRLAELLLFANGVAPGTVHASCALFCFNAARLAGRLDENGVVLPLAEQDRALWDRALIERGIAHLGAAAGGSDWTPRHIEAGIAFEHARAKSVTETDWPKILEYYDALSKLSPGAVVGLNRAIALTEVQGLDAGSQALDELARSGKLARYSFFWAARADIQRRAQRPEEARSYYQRAAELALSSGERRSYERRLAELER